ncbi:MAG: MerR family transcriptional regulator [Clostridia bacterium]|nr:MerR family transcriptional regulator [Clostridia bacterium]
MEYKVSELANKAGVTKRTIHYYISKGLLLPPEGTGVNSIYTDEHLNRLLLIKKLQAEYMPLNKIRDYIMENPTEKVDDNNTKTIKKNKVVVRDNNHEVYIRENVCDIFEIHYSEENGEKYKHIIENVKKYVKKMMED